MIYIKESKGPKVSASDKRFLNKELYKKTSGTYFDKIPLKDIMDILSKRNLVLLQEDNTVWSGMLLGNQGTEYFDIAYKGSSYKDSGFVRYVPVINSSLALQWYKMESGRYEIVTYVT